MGGKAELIISTLINWSTLSFRYTKEYIENLREREQVSVEVTRRLLIAAGILTLVTLPVGGWGSLLLIPLVYGTTLGAAIEQTRHEAEKREHNISYVVTPQPIAEETPSKQNIIRPALQTRLQKVRDFFAKKSSSNITQAGLSTKSMLTTNKTESNKTETNTNNGDKKIKNTDVKNF